VSGNAERVHRRHGDARIGEEVPTSPGQVFFDDQCVPSDISVDLEKATNGIDADDAPGPIIPIDDLVDWTYEVTNTGEVPLINVAVTDDQGVAVTCPESELGVGESMTCTASGISVEGQYENLGTADATSVAGYPVSGDDPSHYYGRNANIDIEKSTNGEDADEPTGPLITPGQAVSWIYEVTNDGGEPLTKLTVVDDQGVTVNCQKSELAPGESMTCTAVGTAQAGQCRNVGSVTGPPSTRAMGWYGPTSSATPGTRLC
jgi:hypothetical protein